MATKKKITLKFFKRKKSSNMGKQGPAFCMCSVQAQFEDTTDILELKEFAEIAIIGLKLSFYKDKNPNRAKGASPKHDLDPILPGSIEDGDVIFLMPETKDGEPDFPSVWTGQGDIITLPFRWRVQ